MPNYGAVHITVNTTGKLMFVHGINTPSDGEFCREMAEIEGCICQHCYSKDSCAHWKNLYPALKRNLFMCDRPLEDWEIPKFKPGSVSRLHMHGEIRNQQHADNFWVIVKSNPQVKFGWWSKRPRYVQRILAKNDWVCLPNLSLRYSVKMIGGKTPTTPKGFHGVFHVLPPDDPRPINCGGRQCINCMICYDPEHRDPVYERLK